MSDDKIQITLLILGRGALSRLKSKNQEHLNHLEVWQGIYLKGCVCDPEPEDSGLPPGSVHELCSQGCQGFQILRHRTSCRRNTGEEVKEYNSSLALVV